MRDILGLNQREPPSYDDLIGALFREFPELKFSLEKELRWWDSEQPGATVIFEDIFCPYVTRVVIEGNQVRMIRVCTFLEWMADAPNEDVQDVLKVTVLRRVAENLDGEESLIPHMGPRTRSLLTTVFESL